MRTARSMIGVRSLWHYYRRVQRVGSGRVIADARVLSPRIEHGRWLVDCPECGAGIAIEPDWVEVGCLECAHWFKALVVPDDRHAIEAVLDVRRAVVNRNWRPGETVAQLRDENDRETVALPLGVE